MANNIAVMTGKLNSIEKILDFAIADEEQASKFYIDLAQKMGNPTIRKVIEDFAKEELAHKAKLEAVKQGEFVIKPESVRSLDIADYVIDVEPSADMSSDDVLVVAMKKEKTAYRLYLDLAVKSQNEELSEMFLNLAQQEAQHALWFEIEYDKKLLKAEECGHPGTAGFND